MFILLVAPSHARRSEINGAAGCGLLTSRNNIPDCHREIGYNARLTRPIHAGFTMNPIEPNTMQHSASRASVGLELPDAQVKGSERRYCRTDRAMTLERAGNRHYSGWKPQRIDQTYIRHQQTREHS